MSGGLREKFRGRGLRVKFKDPTREYDVVEVVGKGAYGVVFLGRHRPSKEIGASASVFVGTVGLVW